jgi:hypothetical protein
MQIFDIVEGKAVYRRDYTASYGQASIYLFYVFWSTENGDAQWELCDGIEVCGTYAYAGGFGAGCGSYYPNRPC